jgi:hypothetical protein
MATLRQSSAGLDRRPMPSPHFAHQDARRVVLVGPHDADAVELVARLTLLDGAVVGDA